MLEDYLQSDRGSKPTNHENMNIDCLCGKTQPVGDVGFYDIIAPLYSRIYGQSWDAIVEAQGQKIREIIAASLEPQGNAVRDVLDSACGIGTQILHLGKDQSYRLTGVDLSAGAIEQARLNAAQYGAKLVLLEGNMLALSSLLPGKRFDVVLSCDNVLRHLPNEAAIKLATAELYTCLKPGGIVIATLRDLIPEQQQANTGGSGYSIKPYSAHRFDDTLEAYFQVGRFEDDFYYLDFFAVTKQGQIATAKTASLRLLAVTVNRVSAIFLESGFENVQIIHSVPEFYGHDVLIARKPHTEVLP